MSYLSASESKTVLKIYVQPGASKNEFVGLYGVPPRLKLKIKAQPQDGEANAEVITFLAKSLGISKSKVEIFRGHTSRQKDVLIDMELSAVMKIIPE
ncbi:DUF167 domain-containing protein [Bacteriovorax sp. PP10]|uniref:UPF0235 protein SHI21_16485 n=1 Tax=Bacteriovorax antarcticus TaxID=3088717 RepID=A0ABU5W0P0_9BACT|nr:DUF167 domain-containing protein [Bacteriovorax sp. PP10]MEA9357830.1 DUF167 domain-containing protein [Bacteriovorax sp. PP10]